MKETRRLKKEARRLEKGLQFLDGSQTRMKNILEDLDELANCNMYTNYSALKTAVQNAISNFYGILRLQITSTIRRVNTNYEKALKSTERD